MAITFVTLQGAELASVGELLVRAWERNFSKKAAMLYFDWRYGAPENGETLVACDSGRCIGILGSFTRRYLMAGREEAVRETCDWFCLPEYRALGIGLHLMRQMMARPEPILVIGGSEFTHNLLPRLKWARLPEVDNFALFTSTRMRLGLKVYGRWRASAVLAQAIPDIRLIWRFPKEPPPSSNAQVRASTLLDLSQLPRIAPYALVPLLEISSLLWLARAPTILGEFTLLSFYCHGEIIGFSINRLQTTPFGTKGQIVHLHAARFEMIKWMVSETVQHLIRRGVGAIFCRASCPIIGEALSDLGFLRQLPSPAYCWPPNKAPPTGPIHLTSMRADDLFF
jgi:hypothetical protein